MQDKKYILITENLKIGDVICTRNEEPTSRMIRKALSCDYSHVLLYVADSSCIHADKEGVHSFNTQRLLHNHPEEFKVLRHKSLGKLNDQSAIEFCKYARSKIGTEYSKIDATKSGVARKFKRKLKIDSNYQFCSRLIAESFAAYNLAFFDDATLCTPADILDSGDFECVTDIVREASPEEIEFALDTRKDSIGKQTRITNAILADARIHFNTKKIQTLEDLYQWVVENPDSDEAVSELLTNSGYLTMWADDVMKCPWRYFRTCYPVQNTAGFLDEIGLLREKKMAEHDFRRFNDEGKRFASLLQKKQYKTFFAMVNLYRILTSLAIQRIELFEWLLKSNINNEI
jgi:hypothetical protein